MMQLEIDSLKNYSEVLLAANSEPDLLKMKSLDWIGLLRRH